MALARCQSAGGSKHCTLLGPGAVEGDVGDAGYEGGNQDVVEGEFGGDPGPGFVFANSPNIQWPAKFYHAVESGLWVAFSTGLLESPSNV